MVDPVRVRRFTPTQQTKGKEASKASAPEVVDSGGSGEPADVSTINSATPAHKLPASFDKTVRASFDALHTVAGRDIPGNFAARMAQTAVRAMESEDGLKNKAELGQAFLKFFAKSGLDAKAAEESQSLLEQTSPKASGAASAYLTELRSIAMKDAKSVPGVGFDLGSRDLSVSPTDNFYQHANGGWIENNPIPADKSRWGRFNELRDASSKVQSEILKEYAGISDAEQGSEKQKLGDFYFSALDTASIEKAGLAPVQGLMDSIDSITDRASLEKAVVKLHNAGISPFFSFGSEADAKDSNSTIGAAYQGGLGLPNKDYYTKSDEKSVNIRKDYVDHVGKMLGLLGESPQQAGADAEKVMAFETRLANASLSRAEIRDPEATYNIKTRAELGELTPGLDWNGYLDGRGTSVDSINLGTPKFFQELDKALSDTPIDDLKTYMKWNLLNSTAGMLPARFDEADFEFYGKKLGGAIEREPREKRMSDLTNNYLGMALGKAYVERAFPPEAKERALDMIENIRGAIGEHVSSLEWMGEDTKAAALDKLGKVSVKVGYPDEWPSYDGLDIERGVHGDNVMRCKAFREAEDIAKIGKPVDKSEWHMTPSTVNAYYNPSGNEIVFPAAILQPPFFDPKADDAVNYGGIGMVIGHEFTHGFDDQGSQFDGDGNLRNWWSDKDKAEFKTRSGALGEQIKNYEVEPGLHHDPELVMGESLADLGGMTLALTALQNSLKGKGFDEKVEGFTPEQRFFQGVAQVWAANARPEYVRQQIATDPHPIPVFRVNQTLKNVPAFGAAFGVTADDPMALTEDKRAHLW